MAERLGKITVLAGGWSSERAVSLDSGRNCAEALKARGWDVDCYDVSGAVETLLRHLRTRKPDLVFNALHGTYGEDGAIVGLLELMGLRYTHSGIAASAIAMDKLLTKRILQKFGIKFAKSKRYNNRYHLQNSAAQKKQSPLSMTPPFVLKPVRQGSSCGVHIIKDAQMMESLAPAEEIVTQDYMVERYIDGKELTVAVLDGYGALGVTELIPKQGFYDYDAKYQPGITTHVCPAEIPDGLANACKTQAETAHQTLDCRQVSRSDFRYDEQTGTLYFLEINTHPGMTATSLVPEQAQLHGLDFADLCEHIVTEASAS